MRFYLVAIKSYRDETIDLEDLKRYGRVFTNEGDALTYRDELEKKCSGWLVADVIELPGG